MSQVRPLVRRFRQVFSLLVKVKDVLPNEKEITEHELIEAMILTEKVVHDRLKGNPLEWKGDDKRKFETLFNSIKTEVTEVVRDYFSTDGQPARGVTINKFNTLILDSVFELMQAAGPTRASRLITKLRQAVERDMANLPDMHADDAIVAKTLLQRYSTERVQRLRKPKKMTRAHRLSIIEAVATRLQAA